METINLMIGKIVRAIDSSGKPYKICDKVSLSGISGYPASDHYVLVSEVDGEIKLVSIEKMSLYVVQG